MKLSTQEEFGLRCLIAIAKEGENGSLTIPLLSKREGISQSHVAKLLALLKKGGFVNSNRGQIGGYVLTRRPEEIFVNELLCVLGGRIYREGFCGRFNGQEDECVHMTDCSILPLWFTIQQAVDNAISGMTLRELVNPSAGVNAKFYDSTRHLATSGNR